MAALIQATDRGLWCEAGGFHIDPWRPVDRAIVTHAHSDHAVWGCGSYLASPTGAVVLRERLGATGGAGGGAPRIETAEWGKGVRIGNVRVSLHPAGHILGSAQVRVERDGEVWVVSGDYKPRPSEGAPDGDLDATAEPHEVVRCDVFITESTFGLPIYRWRSQREVYAQINAWWRANAERGRTSVVYAYALGKAQRVLAGLDESIGPIGVHGAVERMNAAYEACGIRLPPRVRAVEEGVKEVKGRGIVIAPPSAAGTPWLRRLTGPDGVATAMASGWMRVRGARRWRSVDRGFVLSDHADWDGLLRTIEATGARKIGVTHGFTGPLVRWLREHGRDAFVVPTRYEGEEEAKESGAGEARAEPGTDPARSAQGDESPGGGA